MLRTRRLATGNRSHVRIRPGQTIRSGLQNVAAEANPGAWYVVSAGTYSSPNLSSSKTRLLWAYVKVPIGRCGDIVNPKHMPLS